MGDFGGEGCGRGDRNGVEQSDWANAEWAEWPTLRKVSSGNCVFVPPVSCNANTHATAPIIINQAMALPSLSLSKSFPLTSSDSIPILPLSHPSSTSTLHFPAKLTFQNPQKLSIFEHCTRFSTKTRVSFFPTFLTQNKDAKALKEELLEAIKPLDRGADATLEDQQRIDQLTLKLEAVNPTKEPLKSDLLNGKWELIYTTSKSILQLERPKFLRSRGNYQAINPDTLRA